MRVLIALILCVCAASGGEPPLVLAHYMPWFSGRSASGSWGWHWTFGKRDPNRTIAPGRVDLASHYQPLIGLYDSSDRDVLECQLLQMRLAGIDGFIIDWYGTSNFRDYAAIHRHTQELIAVGRKLGMRYAICYEDQTVKHMIAGNALPATEAEAQGARDLAWLERECFADPLYLRIHDRPALLVFGPQQFESATWKALLDRCASGPLLLTLPHRMTAAGSQAIFGWPPVHGGKAVDADSLQRYFADLSGRAASGTTVLPTAFPRFHDFYQEAGLHPSYGSIPDRSGATLRESLTTAMRMGAPAVQIATWNDYGEGTVIEPTVELGYRDLMIIAETLRSIGDNPPVRQEADLALPARLLEVRRSRSLSLMQCDAAADALRSGDLERAQRILAP